MKGFRTPFDDAAADHVPTKGSKGAYDTEPNLPEGLPGRTGGLLPEKHRDDIPAKVPGFVEVGRTFKIG